MELVDSKVRVVLRVRPVITGDSGSKCVELDPPRVNLRMDSQILSYTFDGCYDGSRQSQEAIFAKEVVPLIQKVLQGINVTIFAYGATGAGKTHTMQESEEDPGIIPRAIDLLMKMVRNPKDGREISVGVSYLEIYKEKVYDLLDSKVKDDLPIREDSQKNIFIPGLTEVPVDSAEAFRRVYASGCKKRTTAATKLNHQSSRSHAILQVRVSSKRGGVGRVGKLHLIDLAGSEDNRRTDNSGVRMTESTAINQSLFVLGNVVNALNSGLSRVPYRDSKLTRLLQDSLGGNSFSLMIANIAPVQKFLLETYNTLNFALKALRITNKPVVNEIHETPPVEAVQVLEPKRQSGGNKRKLSGENSNQEQPKRKAMRTATNNTMANKENNPNTDLIVAQRVEEELQRMKKQFLSPWIRKQRMLDDTTQLRLEKLERRLYEQNLQSAEAELADAAEAETVMDPRQLDLMTPTTRTCTAKTFVQKAKALEEEGRHKEALQQYNQALRAVLALPPEESSRIKQKLQSKIKKLEGLLATTHAGQETPLHNPQQKQRKKVSTKPTAISLDEEPAGQSQSQEELVSPLPFSPNIKQEQAILRILNTGDKSVLLQLSGVGEKRANAIIEARNNHTFTALKDLAQIAGFGAKFVASILEKNKHLVTAGCC